MFDLTFSFDDDVNDIKLFSYPVTSWTDDIVIEINLLLMLSISIK